jgi:threonine synthase
VVPRFFATGMYARQAAVHATPSPSMDIQVASNFERYLYELAGRDGTVVAGWMRAFQEQGALHVTQAQLAAARAAFDAVAVDDDAVRGP